MNAERQARDRYDRVEYDSGINRFASISWLRFLGSMLSFPVFDTDPQRVLELGCGIGSHLNFQATCYPDTLFVGVDSGRENILTAKRNADKLGLRNVEYQHQKFKTSRLYIGECDLILCHGVYSWIDRQDRAELLGIIDESLSMQGLAFVSFNAAPAWNARGIIRHYLMGRLGHAEGEPEELLLAARRCLHEWEATLGTSHLDYFIRNELELLRSLPDSYLYHEHLAPVNDPSTFRDFAEEMSKASLHVICDALPSLNVMAGDSDLPKKWVCGDETALAERSLQSNCFFHRALLTRAEAKSGSRMRRGSEMLKSAGLGDWRLMPGASMKWKIEELAVGQFEVMPELMEDTFSGWRSEQIDFVMDLLGGLGTRRILSDGGLEIAEILRSLDGETLETRESCCEALIGLMEAGYLEPYDAGYEERSRPWAEIHWAQTMRHGAVSTRVVITPSAGYQRVSSFDALLLDHLADGLGEDDLMALTQEAIDNETLIFEHDGQGDISTEMLVALLWHRIWTFAGWGLVRRFG